MPRSSAALAENPRIQFIGILLKWTSRAARATPECPAHFANRYAIPTITAKPLDTRQRGSRRRSDRTENNQQMNAADQFVALGGIQSTRQLGSSSIPTAQFSSWATASRSAASIRSCCYNSDNVRDLTAPGAGTTFANTTGSNPSEGHIPGAAFPGIFEAFAEQSGLQLDVAISARNAATLQGQYLNSNPAGWDLRGNVASQPWDTVVCGTTALRPCPRAAARITFAGRVFDRDAGHPSDSRHDDGNRRDHRPADHRRSLLPDQRGRRPEPS